DRSFTEKRAVLRALIRAEGEACTDAIIFCNRKMDVDVVSKSLKQHGFNAAPIHGDLDQSVRMKTLDGFRDGSVHLLVASDVAARGLDIPAVSHVFNFDVPSHPEDYVHRIGRTGRAGRLGKAFTIAVPSDDKYLKAIESLIKAEIPRGELPEGFEPDTREGKPDRAPREDRKGRERGGRGRDRERPVKAHDEVAAMEPLVAVAKAEVAEETTQEAAREERREDRCEPRADRGDRGGDRRREDRGDRGERREPREDRREAREPRDDRREPREPREDRRDDRRDYRRDRDLGPSVIGMGDHVPDFILRSFALKAAPVEEVEEAPATGTEG
ncbi:MAG: helicase-related protein, partial [Tabrizicola sp.]